MEHVFYAVSAEVLYPGPVSSCSKARVKAGSNTFTVALRVVEGDEKGAQCLWV
jgi:hypothetical protein